MKERIVVATNGSPDSIAALRMADALARRDGASVSAIAVLDAPWPMSAAPDAVLAPGGPVGEERRRKAIDDVRRQIRESGADPARWVVHTEIGSAAESIVRFARDCGASLLLLGIGSHDAADRLLRGETSVRVLRRATIPVLTVHPGAEEPPRRATVGLDMSEQSIRAARLAARLVGRAGELRLVYVSPHPAQAYEWERTVDSDTHTLARERELAREISAHDGPAVEAVLRRGDPVEEVLAAAQESAADLIAVGSQARGAAGRLLLGSVATGLVRGARCSVLVVPPLPLDATS